MKYALAIIQFAFAFGLFLQLFLLSLTIVDFDDYMMSETNYLWIIYLAIGIAIIFVAAIVSGI